MVHKIIVDTDPGVDDVLAILLLLSSPEVSIEVISVCFGNTTVDKASLNIQKLYHVLDRHIAQHPGEKNRFAGLQTTTKTKLVKGASGPLEGTLDLAEYFHGPDGLSDITTTHTEFDAPVAVPQHSPLLLSSEPAHDAILSTLASEPPLSVTLLSLGPLTNVALALKKDPQTFSRVKRVVTMGGTFETPGNTSPASEFNFFADPYAVDIVLKSATLGHFDFLLTPLDITSQHTIPFGDLIRPDAEQRTPNILRSFIDPVLSRTRRVLTAWGYTGDLFGMHDPLAAFFVIDHAEIRGLDLKVGWATKKREFIIERTGELTKGMCVVDRRT
ncbi:putative hydrolase [Cantharellus anzutake]|uniref:putative hydrolase n=1 Tax=Cantharellus anzutake TaxID=1750568 RepID=UPI0019068039|nr:putative hydrolase [Cantharellus anzutake]KAF8321440.1 putative hydrolase [Cantharellus anzutake]